MSKYKTDFQRDMENHLITFKNERQYLPATNKKKWFYHDISDNIYPPIRHAFLDYAYRTGIPLHDYINHVRSSQMFAINTLYPLLQKEEDKFLEIINKHIPKEQLEVIDYQFEYSPEENILGEWKSDENRPEEYVTSVDLALITKDFEEKKSSILIEVKFTEDEFSNCGGYNSGGNKEETKKVCYNSELLLEDFNRCYLQGAKGKSKLKRKYFDYFNKEDFNEACFKGNCPFIRTHQCLRNHSLGRALVDTGNVEYSYFILIYHENNEAIIEKWNEYLDTLSDSTKKEVNAIRIEDFVANSEDETYKKYYDDRYKL